MQLKNMDISWRIQGAPTQPEGSASAVAPLPGLLVAASLHGGTDSKRFAVLCHRAAGNVDALFAQFCHDGIV
jgi:hypothetical protein